MAEKDEPNWTSSTNGDAAWKEARERVATRNDAARKAGKIEREAMERERADQRRAAAVKLDAGLGTKTQKRRS
jgi:hypothetical protein